MRLLIPGALAAALLIPAAAQACPRCIYHGEARENAAWQVILAKPTPMPLQASKSPPNKPAPAPKPKSSDRPQAK